MSTKSFLEEYSKGKGALELKDYREAIILLKSAVDVKLKCIQNIDREGIKDQIKDAYYQIAQLSAGIISLHPNRKPFTEEEKKALFVASEYLNEALDLDPFSVKFCNLYRTIMIYLCYFEDADSAIKYLRRILIVQPYNILVQYNIGYNYQRLNNLEQAIVHYKVCLGMIESGGGEYSEEELKMYKIKCYNGLGSVYFFIQKKFLSRYYFELAYSLDSLDPDINNQMGVIYTDLRLSKEAIYHYSKGIENAKRAHISRDQNLLIASMYMNMGLMYTYTGEILKGIECYNESLRYKPGFSLAYQNKLLDINYISHLVDPVYIADLHKKVDRCFPKVVTKFESGGFKLKDLSNSSERLNVGFVSGDFICHPVSYFTSSIFDKLDRSKFNIFCYSSKIIQVDDRYPNCSWFCVKNVPVDKVFGLIKSHKIDILIDLSGNTGDNRMDVFALKPAPIQINMIGYPNTSGLSSMDYRITDRYADSEQSEKYYTEKLIYMSKCFLNYTPNMVRDSRLSLEEQETLLPKLIEREESPIRYGCFNRFNKLNKVVIGDFCELLKRNSEAILVIKTKEFCSREIKESFIETVKSHSELLIDRIEFLDYKDTYEAHLNDYNKVDLALDTYPYSGTTTTCESLLMGVPVLTMRDIKTFVHSQNVGSSLLFNSNLKEYVVDSREEYLDKAESIGLNIDSLPSKQCIRSKFLSGDVYNTSEQYISELEGHFIKMYDDFKT